MQISHVNSGSGGGGLDVCCGLAAWQVRLTYGTVCCGLLVLWVVGDLWRYSSVGGGCTCGELGVGGGIVSRGIYV